MKNIALLELFTCIVNDSKTKVLDFEKVNEIALPLGYIVKPEACTEDVLYWLQHKNYNYNSTFYKTWEDVISKSRFDLFIDQVRHYASTYGTDFSEGNGYVFNDSEAPVFKFDSYKVISAISTEEMFEKCYDIVCSGIALKKDTCQTVCDYIFDFCRNNNKTIEIDTIKNREAKINLYEKFGKRPSDKFELLKYIFYLATGETMLINSQEFYNKISCNKRKFIWEKLSDEEITKLASIFLRYKKIILISKSDATANVINKISRLAKKYHEPMKVGYWESLLSTSHTYDEVYEKSVGLSNFKLITLINMLNEKSLINKDDKQAYIIRNGKIFYKTIDKMPTNFSLISSALTKRLIENIKNKACVVKFPEYLHLACPTSEKNYVGNIPFGSYFEMTSNNIIGIYWRNEWGTRDFDLSMNNTNGMRIGWNADYKTDDDSIIYSGDMTNADPEATELLFCKNIMSNGVVYVNRYNGNVGSKYKFFYANEILPTNKIMNYMVDPTKIKAETMCESTSTQQMIGVVADGKFFFMNFGNGNSLVAMNRTITSQQIYDVVVRKNRSMLNVKNILLSAGFSEYVPEYDENGIIINKPDIDLTNLEKDTLIKLFS